MDAKAFDALARSLTTISHRRRLVELVLGGLFAAGGIASMDAKKKKRKKKKGRGKGKGKQSPDTDTPQTLSCDGVICAPGDRCLLGTCACDEELCAAQEGCCSAGHCVAGDRLDACGNDGGTCRACLEKCEGKRCCLQHGAPCTLDRCCSGFVCKGLDHPVPACCRPDETYCADGDCCNKDCCGGECCKDEEDCVNGACKRKCFADQIVCGDSCCTPPDQCVDSQCVGPCGASAVRCGTADPPRCCHSGTVCCESAGVCYTPGATNCPHTLGHHIMTVCPPVSDTGVCCYETSADVVWCGFEDACPDGWITEPLFVCPD